MFNDLLSVRAMIEAPVDEGDDGVVVTVSVKTLRIDVRSDLVIVLLAAVVIRGLVGETIGVVVLTEFDIVVVIAATIGLRAFITVALSFCR